MRSPRKLIKSKLEALGYGGAFDILYPIEAFGDYSTNAALVLDEDPEEIKNDLEKDEEIKEVFEKIEVAKNRFINFYLSKPYLEESLTEIIKSGPTYGDSKLGKGTNINLEYVSANPTGPLTIGNARGGVFGDILGDVLKKVGFGVHKEYYINDTGKQVKLLGESVARRYIQLRGTEIDFPADNYQGKYITDIAKEMVEYRAYHGSIGDFEALSDACRDYALRKIITWIKKSLSGIGVEMDGWYSEKSLHDNGKIQEVLNVLNFAKLTYEKDGALWMKIDGENDAVLVKSNGSPTYLLGDLAYSREKLNNVNSGSDKIINVWGSDHHGDVKRLVHGLTVGLGYKPERIEIILYQHVTIKGVGKVSKRKGQIITVDELISEVDKDAVRYFFASKSLDTHVEFDLELAKEESSKNPVFYIRYANARMNSLFEKAKDLDLKTSMKFNSLNEKEELNLIKHMIKLPDLLEDMAQRREVHPLTNYTLELATLFHSFYEKHRIADADKETAEARLGLIYGTQSVLKVVSELLGFTLPDRM